MRPPAQRNHTTATLILDAARREFSRYGFKKVTMSEIASALDMGKASLYYYFRTKESIFQAVITREHDRFMKSAAEKLNSRSSAKEKVLTYVEEHGEYFGALLTLNILDLRSAVRLKPMFAKMFETFTKEELKLLQSIIAEGRKQGEFRIHSEEKVARAFLHTLQGLRMRFLQRLEAPQLNGKGLEALTKEQRFVTEIFLRGIQNEADV
jgi:TetR/AcrR family transcriptional regulator